MTSEEFVESIKTQVLESAVSSVKQVLTKPPGRSPNKKDIDLSKWYNSQTVADKEMIHEIIEETSSTSVFGFLCVLDGVRAIESTKQKGILKLYYEKNNEAILLNNYKGTFLHDLL